MATQAELATFRDYIAEPSPDPYTDERLTELLAASGGDVRKASALVWSTKAARYANLVDVQEGSSRRSLGDLYEQALKMSAHFGADETGASVKTLRPARVTQIVRP